jgi:hypothetical protein
MNTAARRAPAVRFPARRSGIVGGVLAAAVAAGLVVLMAWLLQGSHQGPAVAIAAAVCWLAAAAGAWHWWHGQFCGELCWDGQQWALDPLVPGRHPQVLRGTPEVQGDLQHHLWLRTSGDAGRPRIWLWLERSRQPERWDDLRRAVYSRAGSGTASASEFAPIHSRQA